VISPFAVGHLPEFLGWEERSGRFLHLVTGYLIDTGLPTIYVFSLAHFPQFCGSGMFIPDPGSEFFPSRIRIKEFKFSNPKTCFKAVGKMIRVVHPGSVFLTHPVVKKAPDPDLHH
jgi:hypothetical protein